MIEKEFDYIIAGAGCAGLSLAYRMINDSFFDDKSILIIEKDGKSTNDRTWCHWSHSKSIFDEVVIQDWEKIRVFAKGKSLLKNIKPYKYKMIKGLDFYNFVIPKIKAANNITYVQEEISEVVQSEGFASVKLQDQVYNSAVVFKSFSDFKLKEKDHTVLQHFKGYFVRTPEAFFEEDTIHFMDFRTPQNDQTRFFYVLPTSKTEALIEIAIFSDEVLKSHDYDPLIASFIKDKLELHDYKIEEEELNVIPMTTHDFTNYDSTNIIHLGTVAGCVKPSSGFAFERIQDHTIAIIDMLKNAKHPSKAQAIFKRRFKFYDKIFMNVLLTGKSSGESVFLDLFQNVSPQLTYKFLDEDTNFFEELRLFTGPPLIPFLKAFFEEL